MEVSRPILGGWDGIQCFYYYQVKYGGGKTLGAQGFSRPPEPVLRGLFCAHNRPPAHHCCVVVQRAINVGRAVSVHAITPPLSRFGEAARCTIFGQSNGCPATCRLRAAPPGWMVPRGYHPSRGPSAPAPAHRQSRQAAPGRPGRRPMPLQGGLPPADGRAPPGWSPAGKEGGGEPRRPLSGRAEWAKGWAAPREAARPARPGERPPSWRVFFGRRRSG